MLFLRSVIFEFFFYIVSSLQLIIYSPFFFPAPHKFAIKVPKLWGRGIMLLQRIVAGTKCKVEGDSSIANRA